MLDFPIGSWSSTSASAFPGSNHVTQKDFFGRSDPPDIVCEALGRMTLEQYDYHKSLASGNSTSVLSKYLSEPTAPSRVLACVTGAKKTGGSTSLSDSQRLPPRRSVREMVLLNTPARLSKLNTFHG